METVVIRADGSVAMGTGHVMRCLALAQGWQRVRGRAVFVQAETTPAITRRLQDEGVITRAIAARPGSPEDARLTVDVVRQEGARWVVADGYAFGAEWQEQVKAAKIVLLVLDDYGHASRYHADFVLNQNISARADLYPQRDADTRLLLGTRFALLRREFMKWRDSTLRLSTSTRRVLVTLGGSDPDNVTGKVVQALMGLPAIDTVVVVGGSNPNRSRLEALLVGRPDVRLVVNPPDMAELMAWADVAVAAAGSTHLEIAFMGLPSVVLAVAANQSEIAPALDREGISVNLGDRRHLKEEAIAAAVAELLDDCPRRKRMGDRARALVDGRGAGRVLAWLQAGSLTLRRAAPEDCHRLWDWANDPIVRASAFSPDQIPWEAHQEWFARKLAGSSNIIFIGSDPGGKPVGQVRFDWDATGLAEVDVSVAPANRNRGWGSALIRRAVDEAFVCTPVRQVEAYIKPDNVVSLRAFERAGFLNRGVSDKDGHLAMRLTITADHE